MSSNSFWPPGRARACAWLFVMDNVVADGVFDGAEEYDDAGLGGMPFRRCFPENRDRAGEENEEEKENRTSEDHAEDDLAGRNSSGGGFGGWR